MRGRDERWWGCCVKTMAAATAAAAVAAVTATCGGVRGGSVALTLSRSGMTVWLVVVVMMLAVTHIPTCEGKVTCNEYDTCLTAERQLNLSDSIREGHKQHVCVIASAAVKCLEEARKDCDDARYQNMPHYIVRGLEGKRHNMTVYVATYCGSNGGDVTGVSVTVTVGWSVLLAVYLCGQ